MPEDIKKIELSGMNGFIAKPLNVDTLFQMIFEGVKPLISSSESKLNLPVEGFNSDIDFELGLKQVNGDVDFYKKMVEKFRMKQSDFTQRLRLLVEDKKFEEARREAHTLKGQAAYLGFNSVSAKAALLESKCADKQLWDDIEYEVNSVASLINTAINEAELNITT